ncbi:hypothetical protein [Citrobacter phage Ci1]|nr:hypothetical protein [Citrobacter phage Ci1]
MNLELFEALNTVYTYQTVGQDNGVDTSWVFDNGTQKLGMKMAAIKPGALKKFKPAERIAQFFLFRVSETGKTGGAPKTIFKPLQTISTLANILSIQCAENKLNAFVVRFPKEMDGDSLIGLMQRVLNRTSKIKYEQKGFYTFDGMQYSYAIFVKQGKDVTETVFGNVWNKYLVHQDVLEYAASFTMSSVELKKVQKKAEMVSGIVRALDAQNIRMGIPPKVNIVDIAGGRDTPDSVADFNKTNKTVYQDDKHIDAYSEFDEDYSDVITMDGTIADMFSRSDRIRNTQYDDTTFEPDAEQENWRKKFSTKRITSSDIANGSALEFIEEWVSEGIANDWIIPFVKHGDVDMGPTVASITKSYIDAISYRVIDRYESMTKRYVNGVENQIAVAEYTGTAYIDMNKVLLHGIDLNDSTDSSAARRIKALDEAFKTTGVVIPKGIDLYRGMLMDTEVLIDTMKGKAFHFRTFISTSLRPNLSLYAFNGDLFNVVKNTFGDSYDNENNISIRARKYGSVDELESDIKRDYNGEDPSKNKVGSKAYMSMIIHDAHKVPVIVPGMDSQYSKECEVILSRGTTMRLNDANITRDKEEYGMYTLYGVLDMSILGSNEVKLNEVYDGDHFVETGELKKMGFSDFMESRRPKKATSAENATKFFTKAIAAQCRENSNKILTRSEKEERARLVSKFGGQLLTKDDI